MAHVLEIDDYNLEETLRVVKAFGTSGYGYVVTPNVDHVIRHYQDARFRELYSHASYVLLDSRFLAHTVGLVKRQVLRVCLGSDLTLAVLNSVVRPTDKLVVVGGNPEQAETLRRRFALSALHHIAPPMGFINNASAVERCLRQIEDLSPFRFCFLAVGSPQQEVIARALKERGAARGLALCVGAAINYMTGVEQRAPEWMQRAGLEWLYRLLRDPRRLATRYLVRGPKIFFFLPWLEIRLRRAPTLSVHLEESQGASAAATVAARPSA